MKLTKPTYFYILMTKNILQDREKIIQMTLKILLIMKIY